MPAAIIRGSAPGIAVQRCVACIVYAPKGTIIGFATSPGESPRMGQAGTARILLRLLQHIDTPDCSIEIMFKRVRNTVAAATRGKQTSWEHTSLSGEFYFNMSLGKIIQDYKDTSLADAHIVIDEAKKSHQVIKGLKTIDWYVQNPAMARLDAASCSRMGKDSLFVIGRTSTRPLVARQRCSDLHRKLHVHHERS